MADDPPPATGRPDSVSDGGRLDSWKEIAAYLKRDVTTVRRWEKREGLPVHRHLHDQRDSVYAYRIEVDQWSQARGNHVIRAPSIEKVPPSHSVPRLNLSRRDRFAWALVVILLVAAVSSTAALVVRRGRPDARERAPLSFAEFPPEGASFGTMALSPDGRQLAFTATSNGGKPMLWLRPLQSLTRRALPGTDGAAFPFWAPDGQAIGFFANGALKRISLAGGLPQLLCEAPDGRGGSWNAEGTIIFSPSRESGVARVPAAGGLAASVTSVDRPHERGHLWPRFLPDGRHFLYLADSSEREHHNLFVGSLDTSDRTHLFGLASSNAIYSGEGHLLFARDRQLMAQPFDPRRLVLTGDPIVLATEVLQRWNLDHNTDFTVSDNGILIYRSLRGLDTQLVWRGRVEHQSALVEQSSTYSEPTLSPDGKRVAVAVFDPHPSERFGFGLERVTADIWIMDAASGAAFRFTFDPSADFAPVWSPDGNRIVFASNRRGTLDLYQKRADGVDGEELLLESASAKVPTAWSRDGRYVVYSAFTKETREDLWLLPMIGERRPTPLMRTNASEEQATVSPDGRWFAYTSNESGNSEVYVQGFPSPAGKGKWQISTGGGGDARWSGDGRELFYLAQNRTLMAVPIKAGVDFEHGTASPLFDTGMDEHWGEARNHYDVSRDGRQFLFMTPVADDRASPFTVVVNWASGLKK